MTREASCPFDPPPQGQALREQTPMTRVRLSDGQQPWLVTRYAQQRALLADPRVSADVTRPGYPMPSLNTNDDQNKPVVSFILMDNPEHARLRKTVTPPFTVKRVAAMRPAIQKIVDDLIDELLAGPKPVDLMDAFALPVPSLVICELLGVPYSDHDFFQENSKRLINRDATMAQRQAAGQALAGYLHELLGRKPADPDGDVLSQLNARIAAGDITATEAAQMGVLLLIAGHETTANMIALGTLALLEHPEQFAAVRDTDDPQLVESAVEELLRYLNITHNGRRRVALADIEVGDQIIGEGEGIILANDLANRDPEVFHDPDRLDVTRESRHHVAFGFGVHQCLGQSLARLELQIVYSTLYRRIPGLRLATSVSRLPFKHDGSVYGVYELPVTW